MGNHLSSSGRIGKLVLSGTGIAATAVAWKFGIFKPSRYITESTKEVKKELNDSSQKAGLTFTGLCASVLVISTLILWGVFDLSTISSAGTKNEQFTDKLFLPCQSSSTSIDSNSSSGASQLRDEVCDSGNSIRNEIKIMTYNLCHPKKKTLHARMLAVTLLVQKHMPDVVLFQEVTSEMHEILRSSQLWDSYNCVAEENNCKVFSKLPTSPIYSMPFSKGGALLLTKTQFNEENDLFIATSHLKCSTRNLTSSLKDCEKRMSQAKEAIEELHHYPNIIFGGDMNWRKRDEIFPLEPGWIDAWEHIRPHEPGYTFDTENNRLLKGRKLSCERFDRFLCKLNNFELVDIDIIGKEETPVIVPCESASKFKIQPFIISDHYGLILTIRVI